MKKVKVVDINNYIYTLEDSKGKKYEKHIEFYNFEVKVGDYIYIPNVILDEINLYAYGPLNDKDPNLTTDDIIKIIKDDKEIYLQRYYG